MPYFKNPSEIKAAAVGYGGLYGTAKKQLLELKSLGAQIVAVADIDKKRCEAAIQDFPGIETYSSIDELLKKSTANLIIIVTPHNTHKTLAMKALKANKHVVCEKPFAITTKECDEMIAEAKKRKLMLSCYHNRHWDGCIIEAVKHIVEKKEIGEVYKIRMSIGSRALPGSWWRASKSISGGILYDWGAHLLEYAFQIKAEPVVEICGFVKTGYWGKKCVWGDDTNEDEEFGIIRFKDGSWLSICISNLDGNLPSNVMEVTGTEGTYIMTHRDYTIINYKDSEKIIRQGVNTESRQEYFYKNIINHLTNDENLIITPEYARRIIHIIELIEKSALSGHSVKPKYP